MLINLLYLIDLWNTFLCGSFRQMPTFGADIIRRFSTNVSELKKLAARDFEDLLQVGITPKYINLVLTWASSKCAITAFEGLLLEPHNSTILRLLFVCAHWHGLAKLRMHTDPTLDILDNVTTEMGAEFRKFTDKTCSAFDTQELPREAAARKRRNLKKNVKGRKRLGDSTPEPSMDPSMNAAEDPDGPLPKKFNLQTYKYHSLGDYANTIRRFGTSDSFSTEPVSRILYTSWSSLTTFQGELEHRTAKSRYKHTDKKLFVRQLAQIERREARLRRIRAGLSDAKRIQSEVVGSAPHEHHHIGVSQKNFEHIGTFLRRHTGDPAIRVR